MLKNWFVSIKKWLKVQSDQEELSRLTDRELADIGIKRSDIPLIVQSDRSLDLLSIWR